MLPRINIQKRGIKTVVEFKTLATLFLYFIIYLYISSAKKYRWKLFEDCLGIRIAFRVAIQRVWI